MKKLFYYLALCLPILFLSACGDNDNDNEEEKIPDTGFATCGYEDVDYQSATVYGYLDEAKIPDVTAFGIAFGPSENLLKTKTLVPFTDKKGIDNKYAVRLEGLEYDEQYYYAAYYIVGKKMTLGSVKTFNTAKMPDYVDLGLKSGTLWATRNVGADSPEKTGWYFQWGDPVGNTGDLADGRSYDWANYKFSNDEEGKNLTKYTANDGLKTLAKADDPATCNCGEQWCTPTLGQIEELFETKYTSVEWNATVKGVKGLIIKSNENNNYLFLPVTGYRENTTMNESERGYYWSQNLQSGDAHFARILKFTLNEVLTYYGNVRYDGMCVRPVRR